MTLKKLALAPTRRAFVWMAGASALGTMVGCGDEEPEMEGSETGSGSSGATPATSAEASGPTTSPTATPTGGSSSTSSAQSSGSDPTTDPSTESGETTADASSSTGSDTDAVCEPSPSDIEGPFYRPGIPVGGDLDVHGDAGDPLHLHGRVLDSACSPIAGAIVEIWHATPVLPEGQPGDINAVYDDTPQYRYYGQVATGADGTYAFTSLRPGWYLNGADYRPAHVHAKVWVGDEERLTTQLYFAGDPFNEDDPWYNPDMELDPDAAGDAELDFVV